MIETLEIESWIEKVLNNSNANQNFSILGDSFGPYIYRNQIHNKTEDLKDHLISTITEQNIPPTFAAGFSGIAFALENALSKEGNQNFDLEEIHDSAIGFTKYFFQHSYWDFLHGAFGPLYYLIKYAPNKREEIEGLLKHFLNRENFITEENYWKSFNPFRKKENQWKLDLGLAHGQASILRIFTEAFEHGYLKKEMEKEIRDLIQFYQLNRIKNTKNNQFPSSLPDDTRDSQTYLGWCYSDLTIGYSFIKAGIALEDDEIKNLGIQTMLKCMDVDMDPYELFRQNLAMCHGIASGVIVAKRAYEITGEEKFKIHYKVYLESLTQHMEEYKTQLENGEIAEEDQLDNSILEGLAGIGLAIFEGTTEKQLDWSELLLL